MNREDTLVLTTEADNQATTPKDEENQELEQSPQQQLVPLVEEKDATEEATTVGDCEEAQVENQIEYLKAQLQIAKKIRLQKKSKKEIREEIKESYRQSQQKIAA